MKHILIGTTTMQGLMKMTALALLVLATGQAIAVTDSADVKVSGQIVPPGCVPSISGGAVFDYGTIKAATLAVDDFTVLQKKKLDFNIECDAPTKIAFKSYDGREGTNILPLGKTLLTVTTDADTPLYGLGKQDDRLIGAYRILVTSVKIDSSSSIKGLISNDNGSTWHTTLFMWLNPVVSTLSSVGDVNSSNPGLPTALTTLSGTIEVQAAINKPSELDLTNVNQLDGQAMIQIIYL